MRRRPSYKERRPKPSIGIYPEILFLFVAAISALIVALLLPPLPSAVLLLALAAIMGIGVVAVWW